MLCCHFFNYDNRRNDNTTLWLRVRSEEERVLYFLIVGLLVLAIYSSMISWWWECLVIITVCALPAHLISLYELTSNPYTLTSMCTHQSKLQNCRKLFRKSNCGSDHPEKIERRVLVDDLALFRNFGRSFPVPPIQSALYEIRLW